MALRFANNLLDRENNVPSVQQNGKHESINRPLKKQAFGEIDKNIIQKRPKIDLKSKEKLQSKENPKIIVSTESDSKKITNENDFFNIGSTYAATCKDSCHQYYEDNVFENGHLKREIERSKKIDEFAGEREVLSQRVQKSFEEEVASMMFDFNKLPKDEVFKDFMDDFNNLLVLPDPETPMKKKKVTEEKLKRENKFQVFDDNDDFPEFKPIKKKNRAHALRRL